MSTPDIFQTAIEPYHCTITDRPCSAREELREEELREGAKEGWKINTRTMELCPTYNSPENIVADLRDYLTMFKRN